MAPSLQLAPGSLIHPRALMSIKNLEMRARIVVEGFWTGIHRSPYHGFSVEFTEYREYTPGDDPRYLDWRFMPAVIVITSKNTRTKPTCVVICWSITADR